MGISDLTIVRDRSTGRSRGIAFITFEDETGLKAAIKFDGTDYGGRALRVSRAESKGAGKGSKKTGARDAGSGGGFVTGARPPGCTSVVLKGLSYEASESDVLSHFAACGVGPASAKILRDRETGESRGRGFVEFSDEQSVDQALQLSGGELRGRRVFVDYARPRRNMTLQ